MKVIVLGSGVIGVANTYYLSHAGHEMVAVDRQPGPALETSFANAGDICPGYAGHWAGLRPSTPDGPLVLGSTGYRNLFLNTGHGTLGWTMACGSGRVLTDTLDGRAPDIDLSGLTLERFSQPAIFSSSDGDGDCLKCRPLQG